MTLFACKYVRKNALKRRFTMLSTEGRQIVTTVTVLASGIVRRGGSVLVRRQICRQNLYLMLLADCFRGSSLR